MGSLHSTFCLSDGDKQLPNELQLELRNRGFKCAKGSKKSPLYLGTDGNFGTIYLIRHKNGQKFGLKFVEVDTAAKLCQTNPDITPILFNKLVAQLTDENKKLSKLHHPHVIRYVDAFTVDVAVNGEKKVWPTSVIIMEHFAGRTLQSEIDAARKGNYKIALSRIRHWFFQLALALAYVHKRDIVNLEVNPRKIFLTENDDIILGDFNSSRSITECARGIGTSSALLLRLAEPQFFSPERIHHPTAETWVPTSKDDVWAYGISLYYAVALEFPFFGNDVGVVIQITMMEPKSLLDYGHPECLSQLMDNLLNKNPDARPSMNDIVRSSFFDQDDNLFQPFVKCLGNLLNRVECKIKQESPTFPESQFDRAVEKWIGAVRTTYHDLHEHYDNWNEVVLHVLLPAFEQAALSIRKHSKNAKITQIGAAAVGITGALLVSAAILAPLGVPLVIASAAVGGAGTFIASGGALAGTILENDQMKKVKEMQVQGTMYDERLVELMKELLRLLPEDELRRAIDQDGLNTEHEDGDVVRKANMIVRVASAALKTGDIAGSVAQAAARTALVGTARTVTLVLLPIGIALDIFTIVTSGLKLSKNDTADYLEALCTVIRDRDARLRQIIGYVSYIDSMFSAY